MVYDGEDHRRSRPIYPVAYHPYAPFAPYALSTAMTTGYMVARRSSRLLIATNNPLNLQTPATERDYPDVVSSTSFVPVCDGYRYVPDGFTHISASIMVGIQPLGSCTLSARVVVQREVLSTAWQLTSNVLTITLPSGHGFTTGDAITFDTATAAGDVSTVSIIQSHGATSVSVQKTAADVGLTTEAGVVATTDTGSAFTRVIEAPAVDTPQGAEMDPLVAVAIAQAAAAGARFAPYDDQKIGCWVALDNCPAGLTHRIQLEVKCVTNAASPAAVPWRPRHGIAWGEIRDV